MSRLLQTPSRESKKLKLVQRKRARESESSGQHSAGGEERLSIRELLRELSGVGESRRGYPELKGIGGELTRR